MAYIGNAPYQGSVAGTNILDGTIETVDLKDGNVTGAKLETLAGLTSGTYGNSTAIPAITIDVKGRVTAISTTAVSIPSGSISVTGGDLTLSGSTGTAITNATLASVGTAGTYTKITTDAKGRVTSGTTLASSDLPTYTGTITSSQVTTALGFTPYNSTNPSGYITGNQTVTLSGDATGSGATAITVTLANSGVTAGTYNNVTVDAKGRVTSGSNTSYLTSYTETDTLATVTGRGATANTSIAINSTVDGLLTLNKSSGTTWGYINFSYGGTRKFYFGINGSNEPELGTDNSSIFRVLGGMTIAGNTAYHAGNLTNLNQLINGPGYITGYTETDTLATVTGRGASTSTAITINNTITSSSTIQATNGRIALRDDSVENWATDNDSSGIAVNYYGYASGTTRFRNFNVYDGKGNIRLNVYGQSNYTQASGSLRAPLFYDSDDTNYYTDPAGTSVINALTVSAINNIKPKTDVWHQSNEGKERFYFSPNSNTYYRTGANFVFRNNSDSGVVTIDNSGNLRTTTGGDNYASYSLHVGGTGFASSDFRAPIFYDSNDTSYYVNPNSSSNLLNVFVSNQLRSPNFYDTGANFIFQPGTTSGTTRHLNLANNTGDPASVSNGDAVGITWGQRTDSNPYYLIYPYYYANGYSSHTRLRLAWHTGIEIGASPTYGGTRFFDNSPFSATEIFSVGKGDSHVRVINNLYAPFIYDSSNTAYYIDPNNISNLYDVRSYSYQGNGNVGGTGSASWHPSGIYSAGYNWLYGGINCGGSSITNISAVYSYTFYDATNTAYYIDPASTSNFSALNVGGSAVLTTGNYTSYISSGSEPTFSAFDGLPIGTS